MALWRYGHGWSEAELGAHLAEMAGWEVNFDVPPERMTSERGWRVHGVYRAPVGSEPSGPPIEDGAFDRARQSVINYDFSDPTIVEGHFDPGVPLDGRDMALEMKVAGFHFLYGCRVRQVREESDPRRTLFAFRYDTLRGHIERGVESFTLAKCHATGVVDFTIEARWRLGDFPNAWSKVGFELLGRHFRVLWRHRSARRVRRLVAQAVGKPIASPAGLAHRGDRVPARTSPPAGWAPGSELPPIDRG